MIESKTDRELIQKAEKILMDYRQATGSCICMYDSAFKPVFPGRSGNECCPEKKICQYCIKADRGAYPCHEMHINAIKEANKKGGSHIYECSLGLYFWTSPIYTEGVFSGAIRGAGFLNERQKTVDIFLNANDNSVM